MASDFQQRLLQDRYAEYDRENMDRYAEKRHLDPHCPIIHIAGTNGKSSTAHYLESIYRAAGYKVGLFLSPWVFSLKESIRYDGEFITEEKIGEIYEENRKDFDKFHLSSFEISVAIAYRYFEEVKPDIAIVECGMDGSLDATNLEDLDTRLAIITNIALDHTSFLGTTLSQIALHKAGIIKPGVPALVGKLDDESLGLIRDEAKDLDAPFYVVDQYHFDHLVGIHFHFDYGSHKDVELNTTADYQMRNASLAIQAVSILQNDFPVREESLRSGLLEPALPLRLETVGRIVYDAAQNADGIEALTRCIYTVSKGRNVQILFASLREKNIAVELPTLANVMPAITLTTFPHPLARNEEDYFLYAGDHPYADDPIATLKSLYVDHPDDVILITGSLEFCAYMREIAAKEGLQ